MSLQAARVRVLAAIGGVLLLGGCADDPVAPVRVEPQFAAGGPPPKVQAAVPSAAPQDTTLSVRVIGSGFDEGSVVRFLLAGASTPKVVTNATTFVNSDTLVANITIALDAEVALYDIEVATSRGKKGIGSELFAVEQKGGGGPTTLSLSVAFEPGGTFSDGGSPFLDDVDGVTAELSEGGIVWMNVTAQPRMIEIGELRDTAGNLVLDAPGWINAHFETKGCCNLLEMTADSAGSVHTGSPLSIKAKFRWDAPDGFYTLNMGAAHNCLPNNTPDGHPDRGHWAIATRTSETSWTIEPGGPATLCHVVDLRGRKDDGAFLLSSAVVIDVSMELTVIGGGS